MHARPETKTSQPAIEESVLAAAQQQQVPFPPARCRADDPDTNAHRLALHTTRARRRSWHDMIPVGRQGGHDSMFFLGGESPCRAGALAQGLPEKEVSGNECQNEWRPATPATASTEPRRQTAVACPSPGLGSTASACLPACDLFFSPRHGAASFLSHF
jgi:hypothetical protein